MSKTQKIKATKVFKDIYKSLFYYENNERKRTNLKILSLSGGSRSSKTHSIVQHLIVNEALAGSAKTITIARDKLTWIKTTVLKDFEEVILRDGFKIVPEINPNKADQIYKINECEFAFFGLDYPQKLHGRSQDIFWLNEAMEASIKSFDQLEMRTNLYGLLDYNPSNDEHWIFDKVLTRDDAKLLHSTQIDNPFLPESIRKKILSYNPSNTENIRQGTSDSYMWDVYGLGKPAKLQGLIYNHQECEDIPSTAKFIAYGLDFGYSNDPTALIEVWLQDNNLFLNELIYETGLTNADISKRMTTIGVDQNSEIIADSAEPKSIEEIYRSGFRGIKPAKKGADSIKFGISILKEYNIFITKKSVNLQKELKRYKWAEDRIGKQLDKPIDDYNHGLDAIRYVALLKLAKSLKKQFYFETF